MEKTENGDGKIITFLTRACDLMICLGLYLLFVKLSGEWISEAVRRSAVMTAVIYTACLIHGGVILHKRTIKAFNILFIVMQNITIFAIVSTFALYIGGFIMMPLGMSLLFYTVVAFCSVSMRLTLRYIIKKIRLSKNRIRHVVLVGSSENNLNIYNEMKMTTQSGFLVEGYFDFAPNPNFPEQCKYLGTPDKVTDYLKNNRQVHEVYCCLTSRNRDVILDIIHYSVNNVVHFYSVPNVSNYMHHRMYFNMLNNVPYLSLYREPLSIPENRLLKRTFDIVVSGLFLVTLFPIVLILVALITKITMPGPIFFRQKRTGYNGKEFYCIKFRSMKVNSQADTLQATKNDPRKTKWGDIMRKTNIDELPQFVNVFIGDMSIVGPRPHMLKHTDEYSKLIDMYMVRHYIKPGVTGWSQVTGFRGETKELYQMEGRVKGDIWYMEHWNLWLDIYIIYKTVANVLIGDKEAY